MEYHVAGSSMGIGATAEESALKESVEDLDRVLTALEACPASKQQNQTRIRILRILRIFTDAPSRKGTPRAESRKELLSTTSRGTTVHGASRGRPQISCSWCVESLSRRERSVEFVKSVESVFRFGFRPRRIVHLCTKASSTLDAGDISSLNARISSSPPSTDQLARSKRARSSLQSSSRLGASR